MRSVLLLLVLIVGVLLGGAWFVYGTVDPCGMLRKEIAQRQNLDGIARTLADPVLGAAISGYTPMECTERLLRVHGSGDWRQGLE